MPISTMSSRERLAARGAMRPPSAPPTGLKRKEREFDQESAADETNINVVVRCRGRSEREVRENSGVVVSTTTGVKSESVVLSMGPNAISNKTYHFDQVFSSAADQAMIFEDVVQPILNEMLSGYNCTIFAYGQTGTGKTYTMSGDMNDTLGILSDNAGIIPRVLYSLFQKLENDGSECSVKCSFIELYNEELRDLLAVDESVKLKIFDDSGRKSHIATIVQGMEESHIRSATAGIKLLQQGSHRRQVAATKCNDLSSRSHTVFTITTYLKKPGSSGEDYICSGKLNLVDLAGSENIQRSGAENKRAVEAGLINKSLLTLGRVINALVDKSQHIPYRESKLTRLLQDSLGGRTKTCIIATVSPSRSNLEETISTLDYAFRAKNIRNKPQINTLFSKKTLLREFTAEIEKLKSELIATRQRNGVYLTNDQYEEITIESESRRILSEEQKARIETMETSLRNKVQELFNLTSTFTNLKRDNETTKAALDSTRDILVKTDLVLKETERMLAEETTMRKAHQATEVKLRGIGTQLISTVGESVHDIEGLEAKLRRRSDLHRQNQATWTASVEHAKGVQDEVDGQIGQLKEHFTARLAELSAWMKSFAAGEMQRALDGKTTVISESDDFKLRTQLISQQSSANRDEMNEILQEIKVVKEDVKDKVGQGLHGLSAAAAKISGEVISELNEFHAQLHTCYSSLGKDFKQMFDDMVQELGAQREESDRLRKALQDANREAMKASLDAALHLETCLESERQSADEDQEQLMLQLSSLIKSSQAKRDERLSKRIFDVKDAIVQSMEDFERANEAYTEGMERWSAQDANLKDMVASNKESLKAKMQKDWTAVESRNTAIQSSTEAVHGETVRIVDEQVKAMASQMAAFDEFVTRARQENDSNHGKHVDHLEGLTTHLTGTFDGIASIFGNNSMAAMESEFQTRISDLDLSMAPLDADIRQPLQDLTTRFTTNSLASYVATGETPQKKTWDYPTTLPQTVTSTTPPSDPPRQLHAQTPHRSRSPRKSPKKMTSPRKVIKEVYVDSPAIFTRTAMLASAHAKHPIPLKRIASAKSIPTASLKEVDMNANNHTISLPISHEEIISHTTETVPLKEPGKEARSTKFAGNRTPQIRSARSIKNFSASVGAGARAINNTDNSNGRDNAGGKENFQPSKSVHVHSVSVGQGHGVTGLGIGGGRRLRSGNVSPEA